MTNQFALAAAALLATVSVASAADMGTPVYKAPPMAVAAYNWSGLYAGVHVGYGAISANFNRGPFSTSDNGETILLGGQVGYNWQAAGSPWVFGIEADASASGQDHSTPVPATVNSSQSAFDSLGTVRGRVGYAVDRVLWYVTGGYAWGDNETKLSGPAISGTTSKVHSGWTIGAGVEWAFYDAWSVKAEYLYMNLGREDYFPGVFGAPGLGIDFELHTIKAGLNYTFGGGKGPVVARY